MNFNNLKKIGAVLFYGGCAAVGIATLVIRHKERKRIADHLVSGRTEEEKKIFRDHDIFKEAYKELKCAEATKEVPVTIDIKNVGSRLSSISKRAEDAVNRLKKWNDGVVSDKTFKEAFEDIQDTGDAVKDILAEARNKAIISTRTKEESEIITRYSEVRIKAAQIIAKERGALPGYFEGIYYWLLEHPAIIEKVPRPVTYMVFASPALIIFAVMCWYAANVSHEVHRAYSYKPIE